MRQISIQVSHNIPEVKEWAKWIFKDQLPYALSKAINETAKGFQRVQREHMSRIFTIRRPAFVLRAVKIKPFATKTRLHADIQIDPPGGQARADILTKFEDQTKKDPILGRSIAVPTEHVPRTGGGIIPAAWRPSRLFANPVKYGIAGLLGEKDTFLLRYPGARRGTIFQFTKDRTDLRVLYQLVPRVRIKPELEFHDNARQTVQRDFEKHFTRVWNQALRTARKG